MWRKSRLPLFVFGLCLFLLALSLWITGRGPAVRGIQPRIAEPGDTLVISGNNFGDAPGRVSIAGVVPVVSAYIAWTPRSISVRIPDDASSGLVYVITEKGQSEGVLFTNRKDIPVVLRGAQDARPYITAVSPARSAVVSLVTLSGKNFGYNRDDSLVFFTWAPVSDAVRVDPKSRYIAASPEAFDYEGWSNGEITVRVPTGAGSGAIMVRTAQGESNTVSFELDQSTGRRIFRDKVSYTLVSSIDVRNTSRKDGGSLYLWIPRIQESPCQRNIQIISREPSPEIENYNGLMLFCFKDPKRGVPYRIEQAFSIDCYTVESRIEPARVPVSYNTERPLYKAYTSSNEFTPAADPDIAAAAGANGGREANPYIRARRLYDFVLSRLTYSAEKKYTGALEGLRTRTGDAYTYATLYVALLRSAGIPARTLGGYLVGEPDSARPHFWTELYLPNFGWMPADPALGDKGGPEGFPLPASAADYFFGSISNRHVVFSRGLLQAKMVSPQGRALHQEDIHSLQTIYTEAVGTLESYSGQWNDLRIIER